MTPEPDFKVIAGGAHLHDVHLSRLLGLGQIPQYRRDQRCVVCWTDIRQNVSRMFHASATVSLDVLTSDLRLAAVPTNCGDSNAKQSPDGDAGRLRDDSRVFLDDRDKGKSSQELNRGVWQSEVRLDAVFICENNAAVGVDSP